MIEEEEPFLEGEEGLGALMDRQEALVKEVIKEVIEEKPDEIRTLWEEDSSRQVIVEGILSDKPFRRLRFEEAVKAVEALGGSVEAGKDLNKEAELLLASDGPVFVTHYPPELKAFCGALGEI